VVEFEVAANSVIFYAHPNEVGKGLSVGRLERGDGVDLEAKLVPECWGGGGDHAVIDPCGDAEDVCVAVEREEARIDARLVKA